MKLKIKLGKKEIGELEVSTIPPVSAQFVYEDTRYQIISRDDKEINVELVEQTIVAKKVSIPTVKPGDNK